MAFQILNINSDNSRTNGNGPLSDLSASDFNYNVYQYPIVQNPDSPDLGHAIIFYQNTPQNSSWAPGLTSATSPTPVANRNAQSSSFGLRSPDAIAADSSNPFTPNGSFTNLTLSQGYKRTTTAISLYIPSTMVFGQHASYENVSLTGVLGMLGNIGWAAELLAGGQTTAAAASLSGLLGITPLESIASTADIRNVFLQRALNLADNPLNMLLFKQMDFRKFQFDFLLTPENQSESNNIQEIIYQFRFGSVPEVSTGSRGRFFVPPNTWDVEFLHNGKVNTFVPKISTCFLESVNVDYAAGGEWVTHWDGSPVQTRLTLNFIETVVLTRDLIQAGF